MNRFISTFLFTSSLFLFQGCSLLSKTVDASGEKQQSMEHHDGESNQAEPDRGNSHDQMNRSGETVQTQSEAKLTVPDAIAPNQPVPLVINIQDSTGKPISDFELFQEKLMHLIVVSDDLEFFSHIHPEYKDQGKFDIETSFSKPGNYTLFSDYKPTGDTERVSLMQLAVAGTKATKATLASTDENLTKSFGTTKVSLSMDKEQLKANESVTLMFDLKDTTDNSSIKDLQPYLGRTGHLVIVKQSDSLTEADYIHAHATEGTPVGQVHFMTQFPQPGKYKLWGQFNRNGEIVTADFWVNVI